MMEYYSATKKNEVMPFSATWVDLEIVILSEVCQEISTLNLKFLSVFSGISILIIILSDTVIHEMNHLKPWILSSSPLTYTSMPSHESILKVLVPCHHLHNLTSEISN